MKVPNTLCVGFIGICIIVIALDNLYQSYLPKKKILIVLPLDLDKKAIKQPSLAKKYDFILYENPNLNLESSLKKQGRPTSIDLQQIACELTQRYPDIDGVVSSRDYIGNILATLIANKLKLPGPSLSSILCFQHKYLARQLEQKVVPDCTPKFTAFDPNGTLPQLPYPCFIKPSKSNFSMFARRINSEDELKKYVATLTPLQSFSQPLTQLLTTTVPAHYLLAEELLEGVQCTLEGYIQDGVYHHIGITDSHMYPNASSFESFNYPSQLPLEVKQQMIDCTEHLMVQSGFDNSLFNIEFFYNSTNNTVKIIEVNPRWVAQFADLHEKVDGLSTYETLFAIAVGKQPPSPHHPLYKVACSYALRTFHDQQVITIPSIHNLHQVRQLIPGINVRLFCMEGKKLSNYPQDEGSYLYGLLHIGAQSHEELKNKILICKKLLPFTLQ